MQVKQAHLQQTTSKHYLKKQLTLFISAATTMASAYAATSYVTAKHNDKAGQADSAADLKKRQADTQKLSSNEADPANLCSAPKGKT